VMGNEVKAVLPGATDPVVHVKRPDGVWSLRITRDRSSFFSDGLHRTIV
jgi:hypothetical protein